MSTILDRTSEFPEGLGCLVQAARKLSFKSFHFWPILLLVSVGIFSIGWHAWGFYTEEEDYKKSISEKGYYGYFKTDDLQKYVKIEVNRRRAFQGGGIAVGVIYLVLAFFVPRAPIACTIVGLSLYVADWLMDGVRHFIQGDWFGQIKSDTLHETLVHMVAVSCANIAVIVLFVLCIRKDVGFLRVLRKLEEDSAPADEVHALEAKSKGLVAKSKALEAKSKALEAKSKSLEEKSKTQATSLKSPGKEPPSLS